MRISGGRLTSRGNASKGEGAFEHSTHSFDNCPRGPHKADPHKVSYNVDRAKDGLDATVTVTQLVILQLLPHQNDVFLLVQFLF